jgi:DNA excision repair protein ERCC-4
VNIQPPAPTNRRFVPPIILSDPGRNEPTAVIDTREQTPLDLGGLAVIRSGLVTGDYSLVGAEHLFSVERKSLTDLAGCVTAGRDRFVRELIRLRGYRFRRLLIVGSRVDILKGSYHSKVEPAAVLASLAAWEIRFDVPVVHAASPEHAGEIVAGWIRAFSREVCLVAANVVAKTLTGPPPERQEA